MRRISIGVIIILLLGMAATPLAAIPLTDIEGHPHQAAIERMVELGVLQGRGGGRFDPDGLLTRAEAAKVAGYLAGFTDAEAQEAGGLPAVFEDVFEGLPYHGWATGWIHLVQGEGIIQGFPNGTYRPGETLTMVQWSAILIRLLGYEETGMVWPDDYNRLAGELGLTAGITYASDASVNRAQMARFTATAVDQVERADGTRLVDTLLEMLEAREEEPPGEVDSLEVSVTAQPDIIPQGGGQVVTLSVQVTDGTTGLPVVGAQADFQAEAFELGGRTGQLSATPVYTDASGRAQTTYTTRAEDDGRFVTINVAVSVEDMMEFVSTQFLAANQTVTVSGVVRDPSTGAPVTREPVIFVPADDERAIGVVETDAQGAYSARLPVGTFSVNVALEPRQVVTVAMGTSGNHYTVNFQKGLLRGTVTGVSAGQQVMAIGPNFNRNNPDNWTLLGTVAADGSFSIALNPGTYELFIMGNAWPFLTNVNVQSGQINHVGTVSGN